MYRKHQTAYLFKSFISDANDSWSGFVVSGFAILLVNARHDQLDLFDLAAVPFSTCLGPFWGLSGTIRPLQGGK